jgi:hypothetical protein
MTTTMTDRRTALAVEASCLRDAATLIGKAQEVCTNEDRLLELLAVRARVAVLHDRADRQWRAEREGAG